MDRFCSPVLQSPMPSALPEPRPATRPPASPAAAATPVPAFSPLYQQIADLLTRRLQAGEWAPGAAIPSEMELAAGFKVSQGTVRKAIDALAANNLLVRRQGKGTFVATHAEQSTQYRFLRLSDADGPVRGMQRRFLGCQRLRAPADVVRALGLKSGDKAVQLRRLLLLDDKPLVLDDIWLPGPQFKGLTHERLAQYQGPMYRLFESEFGVPMVRAEEHIRAVAATPEVAALLALPPGEPLLSVQRLAFSYGDQPVEWRRGLYHTAAHYYRNELS